MIYSDFMMWLSINIPYTYSIYYFDFNILTHVLNYFLQICIVCEFKKILDPKRENVLVTRT